MSEKTEAEGAIARPLTEEAGRDEGAAGAARLPPCEICGDPKLPYGATAWMLGQCYRGTGQLDWDSRGTVTCYRIGFLRMKERSAKAAPSDPLLEEVKSLRSWRKEAEGLLMEALDGVAGKPVTLGTMARIVAFLGEGSGNAAKAAPK